MGDVQSDNVRSPALQMSLRKKRPVEQKPSPGKRMCPSPESDCALTAPTMQLSNQKSEADQQSTKQGPGRGPSSHQDRKEHGPGDGSLHSKLSPSSLALNALLASNINFTNHHHQQNTIQNSVCTTNPKECLKVPVVRLSRFNIQSETEEEESTEETEEEESDEGQQHDQALQKTDQQDDQRVSISYRSLKAIWGKQPVVKLYRYKTRLECEEEQLRDLDSEKNSDQVPSVDNSETVYFVRSSVQRNPLNAETTNQVERQVTGGTEDHRDSIQLSDTSLLNVQPENHEEQSMDDSDSNQFEEDHENFSAYELKRLKNIKANSKFFKSLKLTEMASSLYQPRRRKLLVRREKSKSDLVKRRSNRLQGITPPSPDIARGPIKMFPWNNVDLGAWSSFKDTWNCISNEQVTKPTSLKFQKLSSYAKSLKSLTLEKRAISKVLPGSVSALALHPSNTRTLVAAGDMYGNVGLWDVKHQSAGVYVFPVHSSKTSSIAFSPFNSQHLLSLGREGTIRCGDITCSVFDEIYHEPGCLSSFDFLSDNGSVLLVSHFDSKLAVVDRRTKTDTYDTCGSLNLKHVASVNVHPLRRDLCVVAGLSNVLIYDVRKLSKDLTQPVMALLDHYGSVCSASFSPCTGKRILTCSFNKSIRVFTVKDFDHDVKPSKSFSFYRKPESRWTVPVTWDPKQENCFGEAIKVPRKINLFHVNGQCLHTLSTPYIPVRPSVLAIHPTRNLLVAAARGGILCVWEKRKNSLDPPEEN